MQMTFSYLPHRNVVISNFFYPSKPHSDSVKWFREPVCIIEWRSSCFRGALHQNMILESVNRTKYS
jgi:hypothetical protein